MRTLTAPILYFGTLTQSKGFDQESVLWERARVCAAG